MKIKVEEIRALSSEELSSKEKTLKKELFDMNYQRKLGQVEKSGKFRMLRREIAQILTILKEREEDGTTAKR